MQYLGASNLTQGSLSQEPLIHTRKLILLLKDTTLQSKSYPSF